MHSAVSVLKPVSMVSAAQVCPALFSASHRDVSVLNSHDKPSVLPVDSDWKPLHKKKHGKAGLQG